MLWLSLLKTVGGKGRSLLSLHFSPCLRRLQFVRSLHLLQNSFKSQRIHRALSGGDETADLIRKGLGALQLLQMTSLDVVGAEMLLKFSLYILYVRLVHRPPRKPQDSAESHSISAELAELIVSEDSFVFHRRPKEMSWSFTIVRHSLPFLTSARCEFRGLKCPAVALEWFIYLYMFFWAAKLLWLRWCQLFFGLWSYFSAMDQEIWGWKVCWVVWVLGQNILCKSQIPAGKVGSI